jgi:hypothetical protein
LPSAAYRLIDRRQSSVFIETTNVEVSGSSVWGDLAHLGFQPGDLVVAVIAFAFFQGVAAPASVIAPLG